MKKCPYCEAKRVVRKFRTTGSFFAKCQYCKDKEMKILQIKRINTSIILENWSRENAC